MAEEETGIIWGPSESELRCRASAGAVTNFLREMDRLERQCEESRRRDRELAERLANIEQQARDRALLERATLQAETAIRFANSPQLARLERNRLALEPEGQSRGKDGIRFNQKD